MEGDCPLRILLVDEDDLRAAVILDGLREAGYASVTRVESTTRLVARVAEVDPDVIFIDLENPSRDALEAMLVVPRCVPRPVAMFVDHSDRAMIEAAMDAGVSAYIVNGLRKERVEPILDMAISRFNVFHRMREELERTRTELADRKVIERAKGIIMRRSGIDEATAYARLRRVAMDQQRSLVDVANALITAGGLLDEPGKGSG